MFKNGFCALALAALAGPAWGQTSGKGEAPEQPAALVEGLKQKVPAARHQAYLKLMAYRPLPREIAPALAKLVAAETGETRTLAAALLAEITPADAALVKPLTEGLGTKDAATAAAALKALGRLGSAARPAFPKVLAALETGNLNLKIAAIPAAVNMGKEAVAPLEKLVLKAVEGGKKNDHAAIALGRIGPDATPTVLRLFGMDDPAVDYHGAVALNAMEKKPAEAVKPMLRLFQHKDNKLRRLAVDYLVAVMPPTDAVTDALWAGTEDPDGAIVSKCFAALRARPTDKQKWAPALKKLLQRSSAYGGSIAALHELYRLDRPEAETTVLPMTLQILQYQFQTKARLAQLATLAKEVVPHLPRIYELLDRPDNRNVAVRVNVITFLTHLAPEHTRPVAAKLQGDLKAARWEVKLAAARALARTEPADRAPIAKAMAEVLTVPNLSFEFRPAKVLDELRRLGPDAKAALPALRVAQTTARAEVKGQILMAMAAIDPEQKDVAAAVARKMYQGTTDRHVGAAVLLDVGALGADEALKALGEALEPIPTRVQALRLLETLGPKARPLVPQLEALLANPKNIYPTQTTLALHKIQGDPKLLFDRLVKIARDDPKELSNVFRAAGQVGPAARPVLPALIEMAGGGVGRSPDLADSVARVDPAALNRFLD